MVFECNAVAEGKDILPPKHNSASTAFYVAVEFGAQKRKTKTIKNSLEPAWNETFDLYVRMCEHSGQFFCRDGQDSITANLHDCFDVLRLVVLLFD